MNYCYTYIFHKIHSIKLNTIQMWNGNFRLTSFSLFDLEVLFRLFCQCQAKLAFGSTLLKAAVKKEHRNNFMVHGARY